jgi:hypothetical protein
MGFTTLLIIFFEPLVFSAKTITPAISNINDQRLALALEDISQIPGSVLIGDAGLAMRSEKPVLLLDVFNASYLADADEIHFAELRKMLERREIKAVIGEFTLDSKIGNQPIWPRLLTELIVENYETASPIAGFWVRTPKQITESTSAKDSP